MNNYIKNTLMVLGGWGVLVLLYLQPPILYEISLILLWVGLVLSLVGSIILVIGTIILRDLTVFNELTKDRLKGVFLILNTAIHVTSLFLMGFMWTTTVYVIIIVLLLVCLFISYKNKEDNIID